MTVFNPFWLNTVINRVYSEEIKNFTNSVIQWDSKTQHDYTNLKNFRECMAINIFICFSVNEYECVCSKYLNKSYPEILHFFVIQRQLTPFIISNWDVTFIPCRGVPLLIFGTRLIRIMNFGFFLHLHIWHYSVLICIDFHF
jgi:hypothetical protein